jgi:hypothetical protein
MDRLVVLVPAWNSQYFPAPNSLLNLLTKLIITTERYRTTTNSGAIAGLRYLLVTWRVVSSPPSRRVGDTSGLCNGLPSSPGSLDRLSRYLDGLSS